MFFFLCLAYCTNMESSMLTHVIAHGCKCQNICFFFLFYLFYFLECLFLRLNNIPFYILIYKSIYIYVDNFSISLLCFVQ